MATHCGGIQLIPFFGGATFGLKNPEFHLSPVVLLLLSRKELHTCPQGQGFQVASSQRHFLPV